MSAEDAPLRLEMQGQLRDARARVARLEAEKAALEEVLLRARSDVQRQTARLSAVRSECEWLSQKLAEQGERTAELGERIAAAETNAAALRAQIVGLRRVRSERSRELCELQARLSEHRGELKGAEQALRQVAQDIVRLGRATSERGAVLDEPKGG